MRSLFLVNPTAHRVATRGSALVAVADMTGTPLKLLDGPIEPTGSADRIYIEGGDGTVANVISAWLRSGNALPELALVKGGTTNQVAGLIGLRRRTVKRISASLTQALEPIHTRMLKVVADGTAHYGFVMSTGAIPKVTETLESYRGPGGLSGAGLVTRAIVDATKPGSELLEATPAKLSADLDGEHIVIDAPHLGTLMTTLPSLYLGLDPFWGTQSGSIRTTYAQGDAEGLVPTILGQWVGRRDTRKLRRRGFQSFNAEALEIETDAPVILDGDPVEGHHFVITPTDPVTFVR